MLRVYLILTYVILPIVVTAVASDISVGEKYYLFSIRGFKHWVVLEYYFGAFAEVIKEMLETKPADDIQTR